MITTFAARSLGVDTGSMSGGATLGEIVGGDTALDTRDGDTSYIEVRREGPLIPGGPNETQMPFRWERVDGPPVSAGSVTSITVEAEWREGDEATSGTTSVGGLSTTVDGVGISMTGPWGAVDPVYEFGTRTVDTFYAFTITNGQPWRIFSAEPGLVEVIEFRLTYLMCFVEGGDLYLRQKNRGRIRQKNQAARQDSIRSKSFY